MEDPVAAVTALRRAEAVELRRSTAEVDPELWPDDPTDGWVGVGGVVLAPGRDRVALVRNWWSEERWVFPGGAVEPTDATLEAALRREVREETGLAVSVETPLLAEEQTHVHGADPDRVFSGWFVVFRALADGTGLASDPGRGPDEIREVRWFDRPPETLIAHADLVTASLGE